MGQSWHEWASPGMAWLLNGDQETRRAYLHAEPIVYQPCPWRFIEAYEAKASLLDGGLESAYSVNSITASGRRPPGRQWKHKRPHARLRVET